MAIDTVRTKQDLSKEELVKVSLAKQLESLITGDTWCIVDINRLNKSLYKKIRRKGGVTKLLPYLSDTLLTSLRSTYKRIIRAIAEELLHRERGESIIEEDILQKVYELEKEWKADTLEKNRREIAEDISRRVEQLLNGTGERTWQYSDIQTLEIDGRIRSFGGVTALLAYYNDKIFNKFRSRDKLVQEAIAQETLRRSDLDFTEENLSEILARRAKE